MTGLEKFMTKLQKWANHYFPDRGGLWDSDLQDIFADYKPEEKPAAPAGLVEAAIKAADVLNALMPPNPKSKKREWIWQVHDRLTKALSRHQTTPEPPFPDELKKYCERHICTKPMPQEPLAVLAVRKECWIAFSGRTMGGDFRIDLNWPGKSLSSVGSFVSPAYTEAEAAARAYLDGLPNLPDKGAGQ